MATYPGGTFSPSAKNTGDTIQVSHVTDIEDEVTAVEDALLNGLNHDVTVKGDFAVPSTSSMNIAGPSTLATVSAGASTLASLQVTGNSTFAGSVTFSGTITPTVPICVLTHSTVTAVSSGAVVGLSWDTEVADASGMHSTSANSSRITFAASSGWYQVAASATWNNSDSGSYAIGIKQNDSTRVAQFIEYRTSAGLAALAVSALVRAADTTSYVTAYVTKDGCASTNSVRGSTQMQLQFSAHLVSL